MSPVRVAFLAPTPPPVMGPSVATEIVLGEPPPRDLELLHIDTADRRSLRTLGRLDLKNVWVALRTYARLFWMLATKRPRLVYIPLSQTTVGFLRDSVLILMARLFLRRSLLHLRGGYFRRWYDAECGRWMRAWVRWTLRRTDGVIVLGETLRPLFAGLLPPAAIHVVPNGNDYPELAACERRYVGRTDFRLLFLGNLIPGKGPGEVLLAAPRVLRAHPEVRFVFAGAARDPAFQRWARGFVAARGLSGRVEFTGPVDRARKLELLCAADLLVYPTHYRNEGHPWVIVEALAAGLPVVSTDRGCIRECVRDNGRLVPQEDADAVAEALVDLLGRPAELERMAEASRALHAERFTRAHFRGRLFDAMRAAAGARREVAPLEAERTCA
ncbi:MAG: glycosyltransferase family 4 protein [Planctomycetota bacterium]